MQERPALEAVKSGTEFRRFYYLKEELLAFCRANRLSTAGGKVELTDRIAAFLDTGKTPAPLSSPKRRTVVSELSDTSLIEPDFVCTERHRAFFRAKIGKRFTFCVPFQNWLKTHAGSTYAESIDAYRQILADLKTKSRSIDIQFEYNTYIRDFFADNQNRILADAIVCWNFKKSRSGSHRYDKSDLTALNPAREKRIDLFPDHAQSARETLHSEETKHAFCDKIAANSTEPKAVEKIPD